MTDKGDTNPKNTSDIEEELLVGIEEIRKAAERHTMASDGGSSGRSDTNDGASY